MDESEPKIMPKVKNIENQNCLIFRQFVLSKTDLAKSTPGAKHHNLLNLFAIISRMGMYSAGPRPTFLPI